MTNPTIYSQPESESDVYPTFTITKDGRLGFGNIHPSVAEKESVVQAISGFQNSALLVENRLSVESGNTLIAQRTAIGVNGEGYLMLLTIDGAEHRNFGMTISELAVAFAALGAVHAINLDGGGSTALWYDGSFKDRPTCTDRLFPSCDRRVANGVCVMP